MVWELAFAVAVGGALGSVARYFSSFLLEGFFAIPSPWDIFTVNSLGSFLIGFGGAYFLRALHSTHFWQIFWLTGFLGGYTTFSSFSLGIFRMAAKSPLEGFFYASISVLVGLFACFLGQKLGNRIF